jgi:hypothetical protein
MFNSKNIAVVCAALLALFGTQAAEAAGICFKNDLPQAVIVQGASPGIDMVRRGQPLLIFPSRIAWDNRLDPGVRVITIYDANQPTRILLRRPVEFIGQDMLFSVRPDLTNTQVTIERLR